MAPKTISVVDDNNSERKKRLSNEDGYRNLLSEFRVAFLKDGDGVEIEDFESLLDGGTYTLGLLQQQQQQQQQQQHRQQQELIRGMESMKLQLHAIQETLPSVIVGHVVIPSTASRNRQVSTRVLDAIGLSLALVTDEEVYTLPEELQQESKWNFNF